MIEARYEETVEVSSSVFFFLFLIRKDFCRCLTDVTALYPLHWDYWEFQPALKAVEERYLSEIKTLQVELVGLRQKEGETMLVLNKQASQEQRVRSQEMLREKAENEEKVVLERTLAKNTSTLQHHREQLFKVWSAMQTDPVDKIDFLTQGT